MNEDRSICPGCGRHCDLSRPGCERGETFARTGQLPERKGRGGHDLPPEMPGQFRHYGPASHEPHEHGPCGPGGHGPRGSREHGPHGPRPHHPHGSITDSPRYQAEDVNGKLLALFRAAGHAGHHMDAGGGQGRILSILKEEGEMTQRALTERLGIQPGSASEIIGKLEKAGMLVRTPSLTDRRTADISLTTAGAARAGEAAEKAQSRRETMFAALTEEEKNELLALTEKLYTSWEEARREHRAK